MSLHGPQGMIEVRLCLDCVHRNVWDGKDLTPCAAAPTFTHRYEARQDVCKGTLWVQRPPLTPAR